MLYLFINSTLHKNIYLIMTKNKSNQSLDVPLFIIYIGHFIQFFSSYLTTRFAYILFTTPQKFKTPKREKNMDDKSIQKNVFIPSINKSVVSYQYGKANKKVLLVHGWSGRGTQLFKIADLFADKGYEVVSFDAPGHGKSGGSNSMMLEFIACIEAFEKEMGPFEVAVGHSLGGMALMNALAKGFKTNKIITLGSGDKISDIVLDFIHKLRLKPVFAEKLTVYFESKLNDKMAHYDSHHVVKNIEIPHLIIHDTDDLEVGYFCAENIHKHSKNSILFTTSGLGHRKILGNAEVIEKIKQFIG